MQYDNDEPSYHWDDKREPAASDIFELRPPGVPERAKSIYDEYLNAVIGYQDEIAGVSRIYSLDGIMHLTEKPLETPLLDPLDIILMIGGFSRAGMQSFTRSGLRGIGATIGEHTLSGLRSRYLAMSQAPIKFAAQPLTHMRNPHRFVPVHILRLAIMFGKRGPDPKNMKGLSMYEQAIKINGKAYVLEVLVREKDYTILHFLYKQIR
ncbi:hypothetical protein QCE63_07460 [Caballeronia sp. LZ065]|uniref:hypothetical protein n=1 Tax=Caballeronia sp. LZ065 TaxID=3038571 RepID=UPI0028551E2C|nr:hypothetical protein [Caballeronia sp. LZ065]MDR5779267.1 hypothetical protein [Caballeronia sp. LZ065]